MKVSFFTSSGKTSPITKFIDTCQPSLRVKILRQLQHVQNYGLSPAVPNLRKITKTSLWELRILGKDNTRIICAFLPKREIKVIHTFMKDLSLNDYLKEQLKDPEFKKEWEKSEVAYQVTKAMLEAHLKDKISQRELAKKAGTTQAVISRIENMSVSPSIGLLQRIADSLGRKLEIKFI